MDNASPLTVSTAQINHILEVASDRGLDRATLVADLGLDAGVLADAGQRLPLAVETALYAEIVSRLGDPCFGLRVGEQVRPNSAGLLGYATMSSRTLGEAIGVLLRYDSFLSEAAPADMQVDDDTFSMLWSPVDNAVEAHRQRVEAAFSSWVHYGRWITRSRHNPIRVTFRHSAPDAAFLPEYERVFQCPVIFDAPENRITLDASLLDIPLAEADSDVHRLMRQRIEQLLASHHARGNFLATVRHAIADNLATGMPTLESLAERLQLKPWTLRRRLNAEGEDFSSLLDQVRIERAQHYLADPHHPISDIASLLGYSEQSAFNRAFKRWFKCTPAAFRQQLLRDKPP
jgi:AraC-like DNA-binding protein